MIRNLAAARGLLSPEVLKASVLPALDELAADSHWRVRHAVIEALPLLATQLGSEHYDGALLERTHAWLHDPVATIRDSAMSALIDVGAVFGEGWAAEQAVPAMMEQLQNPYYLYRITTMQARAPCACSWSPTSSWSMLSRRAFGVALRCLEACSQCKSTINRLPHAGHAARHGSCAHTLHSAACRRCQSCPRWCRRRRWCRACCHRCSSSRATPCPTSSSTCARRCRRAATPLHATCMPCARRPHASTPHSVQGSCSSSEAAEGLALVASVSRLLQHSTPTTFCALHALSCAVCSMACTIWR